MFDHTSRYHRVADARYAFADGRTVTYRRRRILPDGASLPVLAEVAVRQDERLDLFTYRTLGDPLQFWRIADANDAMNPFELVERSGRLLRVPIPQP
jgi:hypothetical protein